MEKFDDGVIEADARGRLVDLAAAAGDLQQTSMRVLPSSFAPLLAVLTLPQRDIRCCVSPVGDVFDEKWTALCELGCACATEDDRRKLIKGTVSSWPAEERSDNSKAFSAALSAMAVGIQSDAREAHERGEDTSAAQKQLETIVDMSVQSALLTKQLNGEELGGFSVKPNGQIT